MGSSTEQADVIAFLTSPAAFDAPEQASVERIDTHGAVVALCGDRAFKLKRAVKFTFLDYSTLALRKMACEAEIAINRRTAPTIYLGVQPVTRDNRGIISLGGNGDVVDYVIVMRRFDQDGLFDTLAESGGLTAALIDGAIDAVAELHNIAEIRTDQGGADGLAWVIDGNLHDIAGYAPSIFAVDDVERLAEATRATCDANRDLLETRRKNGMVRHCHGDLHLRNICLVDGRPTLFDAIEFSDRIACCDVLYDLAFLVMDLIARDLHCFANRAINRYLWRTGDWSGMPAFRLFLSCRAAVRAKTSAISADTQQDESARHEFVERAQHYLALATGLLQTAEPGLTAIGGLSGTGKSTLASGLAPDIRPVPGAIVVRSDVLRKQLFKTRFDVPLDPSTYTDRANRDVYARLHELAGLLLDAGWPVVADAVHASEAERHAIEQVALRRGLSFTGLWLEAPIGALKDRVDQRHGDASDANGVIVTNQAGFDVGSIAWHPINASGTPDETLAMAKTILGDNPEVVSRQQEP